MAARLEWEGAYLFHGPLRPGGFGDAVGEVRTRCAGVEWDYVTRVNGRRSVSEPYHSSADAYRECEAGVRRLLKEAGVEVVP